MSYQSVVRRYLPLAAVVAVQLWIIVVVPSKAPSVLTANSGGLTTGTNQLDPAGAGGATSSAGPNGGASGPLGGPVQPGGATSAKGAVGGQLGAGGATGGGVNDARDVTHCSGNREFSPSIDYYAPPCTPGPIGATNFQNGGATYAGVTATTITIVHYISNYGAELNTVLQAEGLYLSYQRGQQLDQAWQKFINSHYVLWGRQLRIITYQGQCQSTPPDLPCLESEMNSIVSTYHPYAVMWDTPLCSACFHTLASNGVVAFGGQGFSDAFASANAPYVYSYTESSTQIQKAFASWYCSQMLGPVAFAPNRNPAQNFRGQKRVLGVISSNDPDNKNTVNDVLLPALRRCGVDVSHTYFYDQNINNGVQEVQAGIAAMDTSSNPATDVLCLCDAVTPQFLFQGEEQHNYWPENLFADVQALTYDSSAQNYDGSAACAIPSLGCEFDDAIGLSAFSPQEPQNNNAGVRTFHLGGGGTDPTSGVTTNELWQNFEMITSLIENTGPNLTPRRMAAAASSMGTIGGGATGHYGVSFLPGGFSWTQDCEVVYWDPKRSSSYNGSSGTFVPIEGTRFLPGQFPTMTQPPVPATRT